MVDVADRITWAAPARSGFLPGRAHATRAFSSVALCGAQLAGTKLRKADATDDRCRKCEARS